MLAAGTTQDRVVVAIGAAPPHDGGHPHPPGCRHPRGEHGGTRGQQHESDRARRVIVGRHRDPGGPDDGHLLRRPAAIRDAWPISLYLARASSTTHVSPQGMSTPGPTMRTVTPGAFPSISTGKLRGDSTVSCARPPGGRHRQNHDPRGHDPRTRRRPHDAVTITSAPARCMLQGSRMKADDELPAPSICSRGGGRRTRRCCRRSPRDVLARFPPLDGRPVLEIGAGAGQLRGLAAASRSRAHGSQRAVARGGRGAAPAGADADVVRAAAEALPIAAGACGAVVGLCVFDAVADAQAAVAEIARVLAPGGRFVHLLDMATLLEQPFAKLAGVRAGADPERVRRSGRSRMAARHRAAAARLAGGPAALRGRRRPPVRGDVRADLRAVSRRRRSTSPPRPTRSRRSRAAATGAARWPRC